MANHYIPPVTESYLNENYGRYGKTFSTKSLAEACAKKHRGAVVYRLTNHRMGLPITEENRVVIGWLVCKTVRLTNG